MLPKKLLFCSLLLAGHWLPAVRADELPAGRVVCEVPRSVHDGDTFRCLSAGRDFPVRVAGIDAPETGQAFWRVARDLLRSQLKQGAVVDCYKVDVKYSRQVCRVSGLDGHDIALELVKTGLAWHSVKYRHEQTAREQHLYEAAQGAARSRVLGLWGLPTPQEPSVCRDLKKQRKRCE